MTDGRCSNLRFRDFSAVRSARRKALRKCLFAGLAGPFVVAASGAGARWHK